MTSLDESPVIKEININKNHIDNFILDTKEGTKRVKEKFHKNAVNERNKYIYKENIKFSDYKVLIENEMVERLKKIMPIDKTNQYTSDLVKVNNLFELVKLNCNISNTFKLKLDFIISSINENTSLDELNISIKKFIDKLKEIGITLTINDFKYTMFTEQYMSSYLKNYKFNNMKEIFEDIYFNCPDIKLQLKMCLINIINIYKRKIDLYVKNYTTSLFEKNEINSSDVFYKYKSLRNSIGSTMAKDEYYNTKIFLDDKLKIGDYLEDSAARSKNFNTFTTNYDLLDEYGKNSYNNATMGLYLTLNELKKYYNYEFIIEDLLKRYKEKDSAKTNFISKKKELDKEEANRQKIYKEYLKACGIGFFSKKDNIKKKNTMLKMNEEIKKLKSLYDEYNDLEITYNLNRLSESASIYDLYMISLSSFSFIEKMFTTNENFSEKNLYSNVDDYFKFIFNPNNDFLRETNALVEYNITNIISEKYKLLDLNVSEESIDKDNIDTTLDILRYINLIQNINMSNISINKIYNIYRMTKITAENRKNLEVL